MAPGLPNLVVDRLRFKQALLNLCSNAIKFTPPGGTVHVGAHQAGDDSFVLTVRDTGIGMSPEQIPLALEPFRQIASPFARNAEGTGLGLALVKSLIECHDGRLEIESALQEGHHGAADPAAVTHRATPDGTVGLRPQARSAKSCLEGRQLSRIFQTEQRRVVVVREQFAEARPATPPSSAFLPPRPRPYGLPARPGSGSWAR